MEGVKTVVPEGSRVTFSLPGSLQYNGQKSFMRSPNDNPFVVGESILDYISNHVYNGWLKPNILCTLLLEIEPSISSQGGGSASV